MLGEFIEQLASFACLTYFPDECGDGATIGKDGLTLVVELRLDRLGHLSNTLAIIG